MLFGFLRKLLDDFQGLPLSECVLSRRKSTTNFGSAFIQRKVPISIACETTSTHFLPTKFNEHKIFDKVSPSNNNHSFRKLTIHQHQHQNQHHEGGTAANGRAPRLRMGGLMTALTADTALSAEDKQKVAACTSSANSPETLLQSTYWSQFKKNISEGLCQVAVFSGLPNSAHLVPHHQSHEVEGRQGEVRPGSSGWQRSRTSTYARRSVMQAGGKGGQQLLTSWLRPKMPSTVQSGTEDRGGQRLLTSWMRPKSSSAPTVHAAPVTAME